MRKVLSIGLIVAACFVGANAAGAKDGKNLELKKEMLAKWKAHGKAAQKVTKGISVKELVEWEKKDKEFILVDVREPGEVAAGVIPAIEFKAIPRGMLAPKVGKALALKPTDTVVLYCKLGMRSALAAKELQDAFGYKNVYYLKGGITKWIEEGHMIHNKMGEFVIAK